MNTVVRVSLKALFLVLVLCAIVLEIASADELSVDPPDRVARLSYSEGEVSIAPAGTDEWAEAVLNRPLTTGDRVWVESKSRAELQVGSTLIHLDSNTGFSFLELDDDVMQMSLTEGVATVRVLRRGENESVRVETPNGRVELLHPGEYTIEVNPDDDETLVKARSGDAEVLAGDDSHVLRKGEALALRGSDPVQVDSERLADRSDFERWATDRAREIEESRSTRYVSSDVIGHEDLDDHGEWVYEREYGYVWRPLYVSIDWAPYRYGRWVWIAPWGYTWIDDARWGFAPFHYGRWAHIHNRWCWVPGPRHLRPVYSPALVAWTGNAGTRIGWFPLGPRDVFVPGYRHSPRYVRRVNECNTRFINSRELHALDSRSGFRRDYRFARSPDAVTVVDRDRFLAGRSLSGARFGLEDRDMNRWRPQPRPPALTPYRESVLGGAPRPQLRELHTYDRQRQEFPRYRTPSRIPFEAERRAIEANGGQPPSRAELRDRGPKRGDDFRGQAWREQANRQREMSTAEATPARPAPRSLHELGAIRSPLPPGQRTWQTQRPDEDRSHRSDEDRSGPATVTSDRWRNREDSNRLRAPSRTWNSGTGDEMRERVQRDRPAMRMPNPQPNPRMEVERNTRRDAPARIERPATASQAPASASPPSRGGDRGGRNTQAGPQQGHWQPR